MYKNMIKANMGASKMESGNNMMWGGFEEMGAAAFDFAGTKYLGDLYGDNNITETVMGGVSPGSSSVSSGMTAPSRPKYTPDGGTYDKIPI